MSKNKRIYFSVRHCLLLTLILGASATSSNVEARSKTKPKIKAELKEAKSKIQDQAPNIEVSGVEILNQFFKLKKESPEKALEKLDAWQPSKLEDIYYKSFFKAQMTKSSEDYWDLYKDLKKNKKLLRVQLDSLKAIVEMDLEADKDAKFAIPLSEFKKEAHTMVRRMNSLPEGLDFELKYLKWIRKHQFTDELCNSQRKRWLSQVSLNYSEVSGALKDCSIDLDDFMYRVRMLIFSGEEKKAQAEIDVFREQGELKPWQKAYVQAIFYSNVGDPVSAFREVKPFENEILETEDYYDNLFYIAQRAGELDKAEELINKIIKKAKNAGERRDFEFQKAFLFYQTRKYKQAVALLDDLIKQHPSYRSKRKKNEYDDLTWLKAWCLYLDKDFAAARTEFIANKQWARDRARNLYWLAQADWALDNQTAALESFKQLAQPILKGEFFNYYNFLGWLRYETNKPFVQNSLLRDQLGLIKAGRTPYLLPDDQVNPIKLMQEYKSYFADMYQTDEGDIQIVNKDAEVAEQADIKEIQIEGTRDLKEHMKWAEALTTWGYNDFAKWHLFEVEKSLKKRNTADPLIQNYLDKGLYNRALSLMQKLSSPQQKKLSLRDDELLWKAIYPRAYHLNVNTESTLRKINPNLVWSIMKAETQYKYDAISPVGAVGLMQFMPYTSQKVALLLNEPHELQNLFKPEIAIQFGAAYLKKLSVEFDGQLPLVAAAYNGGPHRVKLWLRNYGEIDFDVFIEHIPFAETRTYVKRVLSFYATYQKIYDEKIDMNKMKFLIGKNPFQIKEPISLKEEWDIAIR